MKYAIGTRIEHEGYNLIKGSRGWRIEKDGKTYRCNIPTLGQARAEAEMRAENDTLRELFALRRLKSEIEDKAHELSMKHYSDRTDEEHAILEELCRLLRIYRDSNV